MGDFEAAVAAAYGLSEAELYYRVTGQPAWLDYEHPDARKARKKWDKFMAECEATVAAAAAKAKEQSAC